MNKEELELRIIERRKQAVDRRIEDMAFSVADTLGEFYEQEDRRGSTSTWVYQNDRLRITKETSSGQCDGEYCFGSNMKIVYDNQRVFYAASMVEEYIPGTWEDELRRLYEESKTMPSKSQSLTKERRNREEAKHVASERGKWGL